MDEKTEDTLREAQARSLGKSRQCMQICTTTATCLSHPASAEAIRGAERRCVQRAQSAESFLATLVTALAVNVRNRHCTLGTPFAFVWRVVKDKVSVEAGTISQTLRRSLTAMPIVHLYYHLPSTTEGNSDCKDM